MYLKHRQVPFRTVFVETEDVEISVIGLGLGLGLEVAAALAMPLIHVLAHFERPFALMQPSDHFRAGVSWVGVDLQLHRRN